MAEPDEEMNFEEPEEEFDWSQYYASGDDDDSEGPQEEAKPKHEESKSDEVEEDAVAYARLRAKYPHLFESSSNEDPTDNDRSLMEQISNMSESDFRAFIASSAREAIITERRIKENLFEEITKDLPLSSATKKELQKELEVMDPAQANAVLSSKESLEWMRNAILGKEVSSRGIKPPRREPASDIRGRRDLSFDETDPTIQAGLKMFGLSPEEVEEGKARLPKK